MLIVIPHNVLASSSGQNMPVGNIVSGGSKWTQIFADDFNTAVSIGGFPGTAYKNTWFVTVGEEEKTRGDELIIYIGLYMDLDGQIRLIMEFMMPARYLPLSSFIPYIHPLLFYPVLMFLLLSR